MGRRCTMPGKPSQDGNWVGSRFINRKTETMVHTLRAQQAPLSVIAKALGLTQNWHASKIILALERTETQLRSIRAGEIYFIEMQAPGEVRPMKIGWATFPEQRLYDLQVGSPYELVLIGSYRAKFQEEARLQESLQSERIRGEWFYSSPKVWAVIEQYIGSVHGRAKTTRQHSDQP